MRSSVSLGSAISAGVTCRGSGASGQVDAAHIHGIDLTSAARLLPRQVTPAEIADPSETELRSFSPKDIADIVAAVLAS